MEKDVELGKLDVFDMLAVLAKSVKMKILVAKNSEKPQCLNFVSGHRSPLLNVRIGGKLNPHSEYYGRILPFQVAQFEKLCGENWSNNTESVNWKKSLQWDDQLLLSLRRFNNKNNSAIQTIDSFCKEGRYFDDLFFTSKMSLLPTDRFRKHFL